MNPNKYHPRLILEDIYQDELRRRKRINTILKVLLVLSILFFIYRLAPVVSDWCDYLLSHF